MAADPALKIETKVASDADAAATLAAQVADAPKRTRGARSELTATTAAPEVLAEWSTAAAPATPALPPAEKKLPSAPEVGVELASFVTLPHRVAAALLDAQLRLVETGFALAEHQLQEIQAGTDDAVEFCRSLNGAAPAAQLELQLQQANRMIERSTAGAQQRFELAARRQAEAFENLARRTADLATSLSPRQG
jgi:hypothetical protein